MTDQAEALRRLALSTDETEHDARRTGALVLVHGVKRGIGASTLAVHLALRCQRHGFQTTLVDANRLDPKIHEVCQTRPTVTLEDVVNGTRTLRESKQTGPFGLSTIVIAQSASPAPTCFRPEDPVIRQLAQLARHELVIVDVGHGGDLPALLTISEHCLFVASIDQSTALEAYATIKYVTPHIHCSTCWLIVNHVDDAQLATQFEERLQVTCDRCLNLDLELAGQIPQLDFKRDPWQRLTSSGRRDCPLEIAVQNITGRLESRLVAQQAMTLRKIGVSYMS